MKEESQVKNQSYASFVSRFSAVVVDGLILMGISWTINSAFGHNPIEDYKMAMTQGADYVNKPNSLMTFLGLIISIMYSVGFWVKHEGQTPGKRMLGIQVVRTDKMELDWFTAVVRYVSQWVSGAAVGFGYLWAIFDKKNQTWHDKIAKTYVINKDGRETKKSTKFLSFIVIMLMLAGIVGLFGLGVYRGYSESMEKNKAKISIAESKKAMSEEGKKHYERSKELFDEIKKVATDPQAVTKLNDENIAELRLALDTDADNAEIWYQLGNAYTWISSGTLEDGLEAYNKAMELAPDNVYYATGVGDMLNRLGRYEEAIIALKHALRQNEEYAEAHVQIGFAYGKLKINDDSKSHLERAIELLEASNENGRYDQNILRAQKWISQLGE